MNKAKITIVTGSIVGALAGHLMLFILLFANRDSIPSYLFTAGLLILLGTTISSIACLRILFRKRRLVISSWPLILLLMGSEIFESLLLIFVGYSIRIWLPSISYYLIATGLIMALIGGSTLLYVVFSEFRGKLHHA